MLQLRTVDSYLASQVHYVLYLGQYGDYQKNQDL